MNMKKVNYTMLLAMLLSIMLCFSLMAGCVSSAGEETVAEAVPTAAAETTAPATVSVADEEMALMKCKASIEDIQSHEIYMVKSANQFGGDVILNDSSDTFYYKNGEDWVHYSQIPETGIVDGEPVWFSIIAYMCKDGNYYNTERDGYVDSELTFHWGKTSADPKFAPWFYTYQAPWLYSFDWDAQEVSFVSQLSAGAGESIRIQINAPYGEDTEDNDYADSYTAELYFDAEGRFEKAIVMYYSTYYDENPSSHIRTETIQSTDPKSVAADIDYYAKTTLNGCGDKTCTACYE